MNYSYFASALLLSLLSFPSCASDPSPSGNTTDGGALSPQNTSSAVATGISVADSHACAVLSDGTVRCWGDNVYGELGNGNSLYKTVPVTVAGITNAVVVTAGYDQSCAALSDGKVKCWGLNDSGQLGNGSTTESNVPVTVIGVTSAVAVTTNVNSCALLSSGSIQCWGTNGSGELGNGMTKDSAVPVTVTGISNAKVGAKVGQNTVFAGNGDSCAVLTDGTIKCWGDNARGELTGIGDYTGGPVLVPVSISGITNAISVSPSTYGGCALQNGGTIECWGDQFPYTGIFTNAIAVATTVYFTCAVLRSGTVQCVGLNDHGQLGNGTTTDSNVPVTVQGITNAVAVSLGWNNACALLSDGKVQCWGNNDDGQLGNNTTIDSSVPVTVAGF